MANIEQKPDDLVVEPSIDRIDAVALLAAKYPGGELKNEWLLYKSHDLRVSLDFGVMQSNQSKTVWSVQILFIAQHPFFDEDLVEGIVGVGKDPDDAIRNGVDLACTGVLRPLFMAFECESTDQIEADIMGEKHLFHVPCTRVEQHAGYGSPTDLWEVVEDVLPEYLGTKRCYWVKLYAAVIDGVPNCEARINGEVFPDLTELLYEEAAKHHAEKGYMSDKVFVLLIQDEKTYKPCPFTKQEVGELVFRALRLYQNIHDEKTAAETQRMIASASPSRNLALEVLSFLPEEFAHQIVQFRDSDTVMPVIDRGKPDHRLKKSQVRSYGYISDAVTQFLAKQHPTDDEIKQILAISGKFHALSEAISKGAKLEDLHLSPLVYFVDQNYKVW